MTNQPRRQRDDDAPETTPPAGPSTRPAKALHGARAFQPDAAKLIGKAVSDALGETLPPLLAQALAEVFSSTPIRAVTQQYYCATCLVGRLNWESAHEPDLKAAAEQMMIAAQVMPPDDLRRAGLNPFLFLPPHLLPSQDPEDPHPDAVPDPQAGVVLISGTLFCAGHAPGVNRAGDAKPSLLVVHGSIPDGTLGQVFSQLRGGRVA